MNEVSANFVGEQTEKEEGDVHVVLRSTVSEFRGSFFNTVTHDS